MRTHSKERPYQCKLCSNKYTQLSCLKSHLKLHANEIVCDKCNERFDSKEKFEKHKCKSREQDSEEVKKEEISKDEGIPVDIQKFALKILQS